MKWITLKERSQTRIQPYKWRFRRKENALWRREKVLWDTSAPVRLREPGILLLRSRCSRFFDLVGGQSQPKKLFKGTQKGENIYICMLCGQTDTHQLYLYVYRYYSSFKIKKFEWSNGVGGCRLPFNRPIAPIRPTKTSLYRKWTRRIPQSALVLPRGSTWTLRLIGRRVLSLSVGKKTPRKTESIRKRTQILRVERTCS